MFYTLVNQLNVLKEEEEREKKIVSSKKQLFILFLFWKIFHKHRDNHRDIYYNLVAGISPLGFYPGSQTLWHRREELLAVVLACQLPLRIHHTQSLPESAQHWKVLGRNRKVWSTLSRRWVAVSHCHVGSVWLVFLPARPELWSVWRWTGPAVGSSQGDGKYVTSSVDIPVNELGSW